MRDLFETKKEIDMCKTNLKGIMPLQCGIKPFKKAMADLGSKEQTYSQRRPKSKVVSTRTFLASNKVARDL